MKTLQPPDWAQPKGYANGIAAKGTLVFTSGMIGWNARCEFETDDFTAQTQQALQNIVAVILQAGGKPEHLVRLTWYITNKTEYLEHQAQLGAVYRSVIGRHYPVMSVIEVSALLEARAKVEIEATAVIPE
jgi:enamine deaminase RidA (YjgF/YER057c/UK114 family)